VAQPGFMFGEGHRKNRKGGADIAELWIVSYSTDIISFIYSFET